MTTLSLNDPANGTTADANLIAGNNSAIEAVVNGHIDNSNIAAAAAIAASKIAGGMVNLYDSTLSSSAASFDITSISGSYRHLLLNTFLRNDQAVTIADYSIRINNDTTASAHACQRLVASNVTVSTANATATSAAVGGAPGNSTGAGIFSCGLLLIPNYTDTSNHTAGISLNYTNASGPGWLGAAGMDWNGSGAVTRITVLPAAGNFVAGSSCTLYGLG